MQCTQPNVFLALDITNHYESTMVTQHYLQSTMLCDCGMDLFCAAHPLIHVKLWCIGITYMINSSAMTWTYYNYY
jgi:hypothetical protein